MKTPRSTTYKRHDINLDHDHKGRPVATIRHSCRHCLTITGRLSGSHDRAEEVKVRPSTP